MPGERLASAVKRIPEATVVRLPVYRRILSGLLDEDRRTVHSEQLAELAQLTAAKVRKDLSLLGSFGTRGTGYDVEFLLTQIDRALGAEDDWPVIVVGIGNLGTALVNSESFGTRGFRIFALYDADPEVIGRQVGGLVVRSIAELGRVNGLGASAIGVVATPADVAQGVTDALVKAGVTAILNFAPEVLTVPDDVQLRHVDLGTELQVLSFFQLRRRAERHGPFDNGGRP
ncbi:MAG: redox-sensing transcriptional repressor Rex [Acidimicrobiales bacterium]